MSPFRFSLVAVTLALATGACDEPETAHPEPDEQATSEAEAEAEPSPESPPEEEAAAAVTPRVDAQPERDELRRRAREDGRVIMQARARSQAGEYDEALQVLEPLLEQTPHGPRLRCEAGYIAFRAGHPTRARALLAEGLQQYGPAERVRASLRVPLAMCLYNRGLVNERANPAQAVADFRASLALRPNAVVQHHLDAVGEVVPVDPPVTDEAAEFPRRGSGADVEAAQRSIADAVCAAAIEELEFGRERVSVLTGCRTAHEVFEVDGEGPRVELLTYTPVGVRRTTYPTPREEPSEGFNAYYLAFVRDDGAEVIGPAATTEIGNQYPVEPDLYSARWLQIRPGGPPELLLRISAGGSNSEDGCHGEWAIREAMVCAISPQAGWLCGTITIGYSNETECFYDDYEDEEHEDEEELDEAEEDDRYTEDISQWFEAEIEPDGAGGLRFTVGSETTSVTLQEILGGCRDRFGCRLGD